MEHIWSYLHAGSHRRSCTANGTFSRKGSKISKNLILKKINNVAENSSFDNFLSYFKYVLREGENEIDFILEDEKVKNYFLQQKYADLYPALKLFTENKSIIGEDLLKSKIKNSLREGKISEIRYIEDVIKYFTFQGSN